MDGIVLTIGKFESVHLGHQTLIAEVKRQAQSAKRVSAVMVFEPYPYVIFGATDYRPLFSDAERIQLLHEFGVERVIVQPFDKTFAELSPEKFCEEIFRELNAKVVVVGEDYRFGFKREGTIALLQSQAAVFGTKVEVVSSAFLADGCTAVSTSLIRDLLIANKLAEAQQLLGFPFFMTGVTAKGRQLGQKLGFPTLNLYPNENEKFLLVDGVYATRTIIEGVMYTSVTNIGLRPTVSNDNKIRSVETHLLDSINAKRNCSIPREMNFGELYEKSIKVEFLQFIRGEKKFASLDELKNQIAKDTTVAEKIHKKNR